jgi:hypothetical protein
VGITTPPSTSGGGDQPRNTDGVPADTDDAWKVITALASATWSSTASFRSQYDGPGWLSGYGQSEGKIGFVPQEDDDAQRAERCGELVALVHSYVPDARDIALVPSASRSIGFSESARCPDVEIAGHENGVAATAPDNPKDVVRRGADFLDKYFGFNGWYRDTEASVDQEPPNLEVSVSETPDGGGCETVRPYADFVMVDQSGNPVAYTLVVGDETCPAT